MTSAATNTAWSGPWGVSFTANLTPDPETGLGKWTQRNFIETIRTGRHMGRGREILPPMPIPVYRNFTDEDLEAIYAYLQHDPGGAQPRARAAAAGGAGGGEVAHYQRLPVLQRQARSITSARRAAGVHNRSGWGRMPTRPRSSRSASQQVCTVTSASSSPLL